MWTWKTCTSLVQTPSHLSGMDFKLKISNLCTFLLVLTLRVENKSPHMEYWCQRGSVQDDLCCKCFLIDCLLQLHAMKKGVIHHPPVMSFYMQTQFRVQASQMGCLCKRQRLSSNHSLLCDCTAGLERNCCKMEVGQRMERFGCWRKQYWVHADNLNLQDTCRINDKASSPGRTD